MQIFFALISMVFFLLMITVHFLWWMVCHFVVYPSCYWNFYFFSSEQCSFRTENKFILLSIRSLSFCQQLTIRRSLIVLPLVSAIICASNSRLLILHAYYNSNYNNNISHVMHRVEGYILPTYNMMKESDLLNFPVNDNAIK